MDPLFNKLGLEFKELDRMKVKDTIIEIEKQNGCYFEEEWGQNGN